VTERFDDDRVLAERAQQGDEIAFAALVRRHASLAHRAAYLITRNPADAEDALQEGTVRAWRAIGHLDPVRGFRPWFTTIVANTARNRARAWNRREAMMLRLRPDVVDPDPAEQAVTRDESEAVARELDRLPERYRAAVALRHVLGLSERETAEALGVRPGTVKSRVARGLAMLREALGQGWS
jgi:RNA polymerase sigma-70 factor (ECF subfamily)